MKKLLIALVILSLFSGVSYAIDKDQAITNEYAARNVGRAIATDSSVMFKVWCKDGVLPFSGLGISTSTVAILYRNYANGAQAGYVINTGTAALDTVGEVVDYINTNFASDSSVKLNASVGNDAYRALAIAPMVPANIIASGTTQDNTTAQALKQSNNRITAGVEAKDGTINRIKSLASAIPVAVGAGGVTLSIRDGDTQVWRKYVSKTVWDTAADPSNSGNTVSFPDVKGISSTTGNGLVAEAVVDTNQVDGSAAERAGTQITILYDQLKQ